LLVGVAGFELATPCTPCKCATRLRYTPNRSSLSRAHFQIDIAGGDCTGNAPAWLLPYTGSMKASDKTTQALQTQLMSLIDSAMDAIVSLDASFQIVLFNKAAEQVFGVPSAQMIGKGLDTLLPMEYRAGHAQHISRFAAQGHTVRQMGKNMVLHALRGNGERFPIEASISKATVDGAVLLTVILRDVTERVKAQQALDQAREQLRQLARVSQLAREEEKRRIARELHDELGQSLTALKLDASWLQSRLASEDQLQTHIDGMLNLIDSTITASRRISADLRPLMLDDLGLAESIEWVCKDVARRTGMDVVVDTADLKPIADTGVSTALYRVAQEAANNAAKHSHATRLKVTARSDQHTAFLTVSDNGRGMTPLDQLKHGSFGLIGIKERVFTFDGTVDVSSEIGGGTCVSIAIPLQRSSPAATPEHA
jgi:PAS domain S-box-containing protein